MRYDSIVDMRYSIWLVFALLIVAPVCAAAELVVIVRDTNGKAVSDAVVWAIPKNRTIPPPRNATAVMDQKNRTFIPHVLPVQRGTAVMFPNSDNVRHQVYSFSPPKSFQLPLYIGTPANPVVFDKAGIVALGCNIHDQMSAFVVVVDTPHFGKSEKDGKVVFERIEPGDFELHMWHPRIDSSFEPVSLILSEDEGREMTLVLRTK